MAAAGAAAGGALAGAVGAPVGVAVASGVASSSTFPSRSFTLSTMTGLPTCPRAAMVA